jgi:8-oxo-dGTP diphosphatase
MSDYMANKKRIRASIIYATDEGILLVEDKSALWLLPGGAVERAELDIQTAIRELQEETGISAVSALYLFEHESKSNIHRVFYVLGMGTPRPCSDAIAIHFCDIHNIARPELSTATREILRRFWNSGDLFSVLRALRRNVGDT